MGNSLIEQMRALLRDMKQRSLDRHKAFAECEDGFVKRRDILEQSWASSRQHLEETHAERLDTLQRDFEGTLQNINLLHDEENFRLTEEVNANRQNLEELYAADKGRAETKFKEAHWTIVTLNESEKRVARDQLLRAHHKLKESRAELKIAYLKTRRLVRSWKFAADLSVQLNYQPKQTPTDPWKNLEQRRDIIFDCRDRLQALRLPVMLEGHFLLLTAFFTWLVLLLPAVFVSIWFLPASTVIVPTAVWLARIWMKRSARLQVALLWQGLAQAFIEAKPLRHLCLKQARKAYKSQRK
jgi:hypothetical protein